MKRALIVIGTLCVGGVMSIADYNGTLEIVSPDITAPLEHSLDWIGGPAIMSLTGDTESNAVDMSGLQFGSNLQLVDAVKVDRQRQ